MGLRRRIRVGMELTRRGCRVAVLGDGRRKVAAALEASWETQDPPGPEAPPALTDFVRRHRLHQRRAVVGVPADRVTVRLLHLPPMPERQLRRAVALELGSTVLLPFDDPVFDAVRVPPLGESEEGVGAVLVVAASRTYVERGLALVRAAGLVPAAVDIAPLARLRVAGAMAWRTPGVHVLVHMDPADTTIGIVANGALYFLRTIEHAWNGESPPDWPARMADIVYEVERVTQFFQFNLAGRETPVDGVWLSGEALQEAEAVRRFESLAGLPVTALPIEVTAGRPVLHLPAERYATAAGLALKGGSR